MVGSSELFQIGLGAGARQDAIPPSPDIYLVVENFMEILEVSQ